MGTNKGKLKKIKHGKNKANADRRNHSTAVEQAKARQREVEESLSMNPATDRELQALARQFSRRTR